MFGIEALDIVIGLIFIYLLFSLFVSIVNEMIVSLLQIRGKELQFVIYKMIGSEMLKKFYEHPRIKNATFKSPKFLLRKLYDPKQEKENFPDDWRVNKGILPSEIKPDTFVKVIEDVLESEIEILNEYITEVNKNLVEDDEEIEALESVISIFLILSDGVKFDKLNKLHGNLISKNKKLISGNTSFIFDQEYLVYVLKKGVKDLSELRDEMENWFEEMMNYATDWYKRKLRWILFGMGLAVSIAFNVDSIHLFKTLKNNPETRAAVVERAEAFNQNYYESNGEIILKASPTAIEDTTFASPYNLSLFLKQKEKEVLGDFVSPADSTRRDSIFRADYANLLSIQHDYARLDTLVDNDINQLSEILGLGWNFEKHKTIGSAVNAGFNRWSILGWLITALAISLGAPFWFDLLKKVMNIKNESTKKPDESTNTSHPNKP